MPSPPAPSPRLVIFDLDGVVYRGPEAIPGAAALVSALRAAGRAVRFATNNSMATRAAYAERQPGRGSAAVPREIVTSTSATISHPAGHEPGLRRLLALAPMGCSRSCIAPTTARPIPTRRRLQWNGALLDEAYDAVVVGLDPE